MIKIVIAAAASLSLAACANSTTAFNTSTKQAIDVAYASVCPIINSPIIAAEVSTRADSVKGAYASAVTLCAAGTPSSAVEGGFDIATAFIVLLPYLQKHGLKVTSTTGM